MWLYSTHPFYMLPVSLFPLLFLYQRLSSDFGWPLTAIHFCSAKVTGKTVSGKTELLVLTPAGWRAHLPDSDTGISEASLWESSVFQGKHLALSGDGNGGDTRALLPSFWWGPWPGWSSCSTCQLPVFPHCPSIQYLTHKMIWCIWFLSITFG